MESGEEDGNERGKERVRWEWKGEGERKMRMKGGKERWGRE